MRCHFYLALISLFLASSVYSITKNLPTQFCIDADPCVRNGTSNLCECLETDRDNLKDYDKLKLLFCSETPCNNCTNTTHDLIYGAGFECQCNNTKQYFYCKDYETTIELSIFNINDSIINDQRENSTKAINIENIKLYTESTRNTTNISKVTAYEKYENEKEDSNQLKQNLNDHTSNDNFTEITEIEDINPYTESNSPNIPSYDTSEQVEHVGNIPDIMENQGNHSNFQEKEITCVLNENVNLCDCPANLRNIMKTCDNTYLFCNKTSSYRDCKEDFYPRHGFGYQCNCNGIKNDFVCKDQDDMIKAYNLGHKNIKKASSFKTILISFFHFIIICFFISCIGYFSIKCCKSKISKCFKSDIRYSRFEMSPSDRSPTRKNLYNRNKIV
ncbi:unnamed protein product [Brachionus calyciflorus]|uniref:EGF-like domain-containing protein n=1 Tax=Brachionus calyciflorus TaxID=104777 RepID=A0A813WWS7_9BILA|nr:unnamed protein product [Brachionus calyciflorus]